MAFTIPSDDWDHAGSALMEWQKQPLNQRVARDLRASTRRQPSLHGHKFDYNDLKELWMANEVNVVLCHDEDPVWQYWYYAPAGGWAPISLHETREAAQAAVPEHAPSEYLTKEPEEPGTYVSFRFADDRPWQRTKVLTEDGVERMTSMYERLGCEVQVQNIA